MSESTQKDNTPQENRAIEQSAANPVVTDQDGNVVDAEDGGNEKTVGEDVKEKGGEVK